MPLFNFICDFCRLHFDFGPWTRAIVACRRDLGPNTFLLSGPGFRCTCIVCEFLLRLSLLWGVERVLLSESISKEIFEICVYLFQIVDMVAGGMVNVYLGTVWRIFVRVSVIPFQRMLKCLSCIIVLHKKDYNKCTYI